MVNRFRVRLNNDDSPYKQNPRYVADLQGASQVTLTTGDKTCAMSYAKVEYAEERLAHMIREDWVKSGYDLGIDIVRYE